MIVLMVCIFLQYSINRTRGHWPEWFGFQSSDLYITKPCTSNCDFWIEYLTSQVTMLYVITLYVHWFSGKARSYFIQTTFFFGLVANRTWSFGFNTIYHISSSVLIETLTLQSLLSNIKLFYKCNYSNKEWLPPCPIDGSIKNSNKKVYIWFSVLQAYKHTCHHVNLDIEHLCTNTIK